MSIMICPECGKQFPDEVSVCPHCACPLEDIDASVNSITAGAKAGPNGAAPAADDDTGGISRYFNAVTIFALPAIMFFCLSMCSYLRMKSPLYKIISVILAAAAVYFLADANYSYLFTKEEAVGLKIISYVFGGFCFTHLFYILERKIERL